MSKGYRVGWLVAMLMKNGTFTRDEYYKAFDLTDDYGDAAIKMFRRDVRIVKDVFDDLGYGKVRFNKDINGYEVV